MNDAWSFAAGHALHRFLKFNLLCGFGLLLNILTLNVLFNRLGMNRYGANAVAIVLVTIWNYTLNLKLGWRTSSVG